MYPIITHKVLLLQNAPAAVQVISFWEVVEKISWVDRDDSVGATLNKIRMSQVLTRPEWLILTSGMPAVFFALVTHLTADNFWGKNNMPIDHALVYHIIARGKLIYDAVMSDCSFAAGYVHQDCGFDTRFDTY